MAGMNNPDVRIVSLEQRPELWTQLVDKNHPLVQLVEDPMGSLAGDTFDDHYHTLGHYPEFRKHLFAAVHTDSQTGEEKLVGCAKSVPLFWPSLSAENGDEQSTDASYLQDLPDGGFHSVIAIAVAQSAHRTRRKDGQDGPAGSGLSPRSEDQAKHWETATLASPSNCASALEVAVLPEYRSLGLASQLLRAMRNAARDAGYPVLVVPLRPTRKDEHPLVSMDDYITWRDPKDSAMPFDPWLRKHVREGGKVIKIAPESEILQGNADQWKEVTGLDMEVEAQKQTVQDGKSVGILFPGCFNPLQWDVGRKWGTYVEPNIWLYHKTATDG